METEGVEVKLCMLTGMIQNIGEEINGKLNIFKEECREVVKEIQELKNEMKKIKSQVKELRSLEWESRNRNIVIFGLKENKNESKLEILNKVTKLFIEALGNKFRGTTD